MPKPYPEEFREDVVRVARNRGPGVTVEQVAAAFGVIMASAPSASAWNMVIFTGTSRPYGGFGDADLDFRINEIEACDLGGKDGLRAVARLSWTGMVGSPIEVQDADGSNGNDNCSGAWTFWGPASGTAYTFQACLRDGATGALQLCGTHRGSWGIY